MARTPAVAAVVLVLDAGPISYLWREISASRTTKIRVRGQGGAPMSARPRRDKLGGIAINEER